MATERGIAAMMKILSCSFAGEVTKERCRVYMAALQDVDDETLAVATGRITKEYRGEFIPPVAIIRDYCGANTAPAIDIDQTLRAISALGFYHVDSSHWCYPATATIEAALGPGIAAAYGDAGGALLFSENTITRETARRDFVRALTRAIAQRGSKALALPAASGPALLEPGDERPE